MSSITAFPTEATKSAAVPLRFVTAASLFDGHDASINIMRRILQASGIEVIHLAHNRSVAEVVTAALQEDVDGIAISSYQGGHVEYFKYLVDQLDERGAGHIRVFGGGGGVIVPDEIRELEAYGVERIYSPHAGQQLGLQGMIDDMIERCRGVTERPAFRPLADYALDDRAELARAITKAELGLLSDADRGVLESRGEGVPVLGITGTGGAGKSSFTDELVRRFRLESGDNVRIAVIAIDPTRRKTGGALLGDRIRMNAIYHPTVFMRSLATRGATGEVPEH
ncbi:MAG: cobalamin-dependent protein, partial [Pseudomonadota bacterium]